MIIVKRSKTRLLKIIPQLHARAGESPHISTPALGNLFLLGWGASWGVKDWAWGDGLI